MLIRKRVLYSGQVQGVGFRYAAQRIAQGLEVAGSVCNLSTGQVEVIAEGEASVVAGFLRRIAQQMAGHIHDTQEFEEPVQSLTGFTILH